MAEKLCVFCLKFSLSTGYDDTFSSSSGSMDCSAGHFDYSGWNGASEYDLRKIIRQAEICKDYTPVKDA